jgi:hypothetical protein
MNNITVFRICIILEEGVGVNGRLVFCMSNVCLNYKLFCAMNSSLLIFSFLNRHGNNELSLKITPGHYLNLKQSKILLV